TRCTPAEVLLTPACADWACPVAPHVGAHQTGHRAAVSRAYVGCSLAYIRLAIVLTPPRRHRYGATCMATSYTATTGGPASAATAMGSAIACLNNVSPASRSANRS